MISVTSFSPEIKTISSSFMENIYIFIIGRDPRIKYHLLYWGYKIFMSISVNDEIKIFGVIKDAEDAWDG